MHDRRNVVLIILLLCITSLSGQVRGNATYYSKANKGRRMSDGTRYHRDSMVCAHKTYPLGTLLRVRNPQNGNEVIVRVADRGPHSRNRMIDLSYGAAEKLGIVSRGVATVEVEPLEKTIIPMKPPREDIPELEFEVTDNSFHAIPEWQDMTHSRQQLPEKVNKKVNKKNSVTKK